MSIDPTTPAPPLAEDETITPPEQPPMVDEDADDAPKGEVAPEVPDRDLFA